MTFRRLRRTVPLDGKRDSLALANRTADPAIGATPSTHRVCFTPTTLLSFDLQGFGPAKAHPSVSEGVPPVPFCAGSAVAHDFEGFTASAIEVPAFGLPFHALLAFPLGGFPSRCRSDRLPGASSHVLTEPE